MTDDLPFTTPLTFDYTKPLPGFDPHAQPPEFQMDVDTLALDTGIDDAVEALHERLEKELLGAWRAGYDYLHVYNDHGTEPLGREGLSERYTINQYVLPGHSERPVRPDSLAYAYTYDLSDVPFGVMRSALRGELDKYDRIAVDE